MFNDDELHYHMQGALKKLHDLMESEDQEIAIEAAKSLVSAIMEIQVRQAGVELEEYLEDLEEDGEA
jgi:hypothetical protein